MTYPAENVVQFIEGSMAVSQPVTLARPAYTLTFQNGLGKGDCKMAEVAFLLRVPLHDQGMQ